MKRSLMKVVSMIVAFAMLSYQSAWALPTGENVVEGTALFERSQDNSILNIHASDASILEFQSFDIGQGEAVNFFLPSLDSFSLSRILGSDRSDILGSLTANGNLVLINQSGFHFGASSSVNVGGLIASTHDIANRDFLAGRYVFTGEDEALKASDNYILNEGTIRGRTGGMAVLIADAVENRGTIDVPAGNVVLAGGSVVTVGLGSDGLVSVIVDKESRHYISDEDGNRLKDQVKNTGSLSANEVGGKIGRISITAKKLDRLFESSVNLQGFVSAKGVSANGKGGIRITADDSILSSAEIDSSMATTEMISGRDLTMKSNFVSRRGHHVLTAGVLLTVEGADFTGNGGDYFLKGATMLMKTDLYVEGTLRFKGGYLDMQRYDPNIHVSAELSFDPGVTIARGDGAWIFDGAPHSGVIVSNGAASNIGKVIVGKNKYVGISHRSSDVLMDLLTVQEGGYFATGGKDFALSRSRAVINDGTIELRGSELLKNVINLDTDSGTVIYRGTGLTGGSVKIKDFGDVDYYNLVVEDANVMPGENYLTARNKMTLSNTKFAGGTFLKASEIQVKKELFADTLRFKGGRLDLDSYDPTIHVAAELSFDKSVSITRGSGSWIFDGAPHSGVIWTNDANLNIGNVVVGNNKYVTIRHQSSDVLMDSLTVRGGGRFDAAGKNFGFAAMKAVSNDGTIELRGSELLKNVLDLDTNSGTVAYRGTGRGGNVMVKDFGDVDYYNLVIDDTNALRDRFTLSKTMNVDGNFTLKSGTLDSNHQDIYLAGDWSNRGTFLGRDGAVVLDGVNQSVLGTTTFNDLTKKMTVAGDTLKMEAGKTQTVTGLLDLEGLSKDNSLKLRSTRDGLQAMLNPLGSEQAKFLDVKDSRNMDNQDIKCAGCKNSGNNEGWKFDQGLHLGQQIAPPFTGLLPPQAAANNKVAVKPVMPKVEVKPAVQPAAAAKACVVK